MPIHLPKISRRRFLGQTVVAGAGLLAGCTGLSANKRTQANTFALFSDIHLDANPEQVTRGVNMTRNFELATKDLLELSQLPARLFVTGDLAHSSGQSGDYGALARLLTPLREAGLPVHLALGNHDNRERFWEAFHDLKAAKRPVSDHLVGIVRTPLVDWFLLDSLEKTLSTPGLLGKEQLDWLARSLDANPAKPALILVHHNPGIEGGNMGLKDTLALLEVLRPRRQVKAYIFGHTHNWTVQKDESGLHLINLPPTAYVFRDGEPSGWVLASVQAGGMNLEFRCLDANHSENGRKLDLVWRS
jgi:3',5'-cyclic AMP phosphodiesterase CpdA